MLTPSFLAPCLPLPFTSLTQRLTNPFCKGPESRQTDRGPHRVWDCPTLPLQCQYRHRQGRDEWRVWEPMKPYHGH
jgi:hypothetical protein